MTIRGIPELQTRLRAIKPNRAMMEQLGLSAIREQKLLVPRKTGNLGRSIGLGSITSTSVITQAGANYAVFVELGTRAHDIVPKRAKALRWAAEGTARLSGRSQERWAGAVRQAGPPSRHPGAALHAARCEAGGRGHRRAEGHRGQALERALMATTFRVDFRAGLVSVAQTYATANPTLIGTVYDYPPESFATPCLYIEKGIPETVVHDSGLRFRVLTGHVVIVNKLISNAQATHEQDVLIDALMDAYTAAPSTPLRDDPDRNQSWVTDTEIPGGDGVRYSAAIITVEGSIQEGRL